MGQQHSEIPQLLAYFTEDEQFYLVQEYIAGHELRREIQLGEPWSQGQVIQLLEDILTPLAFVHQQRAIHRDIKPENLMRRESDGKLVLIDFGAVKQKLSRLTQPQGEPKLATKLTIVIGTKGYMPSEQSNGKPIFASDIYAVGMTAIEALTGHSVDHLHSTFDRNTLEIQWQEFASDTSPELQELLQKMVSHDFRDRYSSAVEALTEVKKLQAIVPPAPPPPLPAPPSTPLPTPQPSTTQSPLIRRRDVLRVLCYMGWGGLGLGLSLGSFSLMKNWGSGAELEPPPVNLIPLAVLQLPTFKFEVVTVNRRGKIIHREVGQAHYFREDLGDGIFLDMVAIPGGEFFMGSPTNEKGRWDDEGPQHQVTVQPLFMGKFEVTQAQWRRVASLPQVNHSLELDPAYFKEDNLPVEGVSWYDCQEFCARLSRYTGETYRLPSEAEWEFACRAGTTTQFHFGETLTTSLANYNGKYYTYGDEQPGQDRGKTTPVGDFYPNDFGLYDMHGNVWEWCADDWHDSYDEAPDDGSIWLSSDKENNRRRLARGGSWNYDPRDCRSAIRLFNSPGNRNNYIGLRVVRFRPRA